MLADTQFNYPAEAIFLPATESRATKELAMVEIHVPSMYL